MSCFLSDHSSIYDHYMVYASFGHAIYCHMMVGFLLLLLPTGKTEVVRVCKMWNIVS